MATLTYNKPLITETPALKIDGLKVGVYRFQLRAIDDSGNASRPDIITIKVEAGTRLLSPLIPSIRLSRLV